MKGCETIQEELPGYAAKQLTASERAVVETHLRACAACQAEVRSLLRLEGVLAAGLPVVETSPTLRSRFANRLVAEVEAEEAAANRQGLWGWLTRPWLVPAVASAAVAAIVLLQSFGEAPVSEVASAPRAAAPVVVAEAPKPPAASAAPAKPASAEAPVHVASVDEPKEPEGVPTELETDPEKFVDFAIIRELETLEAIDGTQESAG